MMRTIVIAVFDVLAATLAGYVTHYVTGVLQMQSHDLRLALAVLAALLTVHRQDTVRGIVDSLFAVRGGKRP